MDKLTTILIITIIISVGVLTTYLAIIVSGWSGNNYRYSSSAAGASWGTCPMNAE